jgi:hypothetical protein
MRPAPLENGPSASHWEAIGSGLAGRKCERCGRSMTMTLNPDPGLITIENHVTVVIPQLFQNVVYALLGLIILLQLGYIAAEQRENIVVGRLLHGMKTILGRALYRSERRKDEGD